MIYFKGQACQSPSNFIYMKLKKSLFFILRLFVTLFLLYLVYHRIDLKLVKNLLSTSNYYYLLIALLIFLLSNITGAIQWYLLLKSQKGKELSLSYIIKLYLLSSFFNNFLPTNVGGDVVKVYKLIKINYKKNIIFSSIIWDRFISIMILISFSFIAGFLFLKKKIIFIGFIAFLLIIFLIILLIKKYNAGRFLLKIVRIIKNEKIKYFLEEFLISFKIYLQRSKYILGFYLLSFVTQFLKIYISVFIAKSMNLNINMTEIFFIIPIIGIAAFLPISINGIGIKEHLGSFLYMYLNKDKMLISIFITVGNLIIILGNLLGLIFIFKKGKR